MSLYLSPYIENINLTQYAASLGYELDKEKSTKSSIAMRTPGDKVIISRKNGRWVYFSVHDEKDNGSIIKFAQNRTGKSFQEIKPELDSWLGGAAPVLDIKRYVSNVEEKEYDPAAVRKAFRYCRPVPNHFYLNDRGISQNTISSERFRGRIYGDNFGNVVFPHFNIKGVCGYEMRKEGYKAFKSGSEKTLWRSNILPGDNALIIGEGAINGLSHYQLFDMPHAVQLATCGGMSMEVSGLITQFVRSFKTLEEIISITDNDTGGDKLHARIAEAVSEAGFSGIFRRHSPEIKKADWNNILKPTSR